MAARPPYYSQKNLNRWAELANKVYDPVKNRSDKVWIQKNLVPQLDYWSQQLLSTLKGYTKQGKKDWLDRDRGHFRHYMWLRLLPLKNNKELYFTIGIDNDAGDGTPGLVIKLDFQRTKNAQLSKPQRDYLESMLDRRSEGAGWHQIDVGQVTSWEMLVAESVSFIKKHEAYYEQCLNGIRSYSDSYRISRITWNEFGWVKPSGPNGKSSSKETHEGRYGYGHEEWLFDTSKIIDGYHYGFLEPIHKQQQAYENRKYDIGLYSICARDGSRYWIGRIDNVEVIDADHADRIKTIYQQHGWYDEMKNQVNAAGGDTRDFNTWTGGQLFNIRFTIADMNIDDYELLPPEHPLYTVTRYTFLKGDEIVIPPPKLPTFEPRNGEPSIDDDDDSGGYERQPKFVQVTKKHRQIQQLLVRRLKEDHGVGAVTWEHLLENGTQVDVVRKEGSDLYFYEIKTYPSIRVAIREAMGQLLEYAYWGSGQVPKELIIVSDLELGDGREYLMKLREVYNLPINYQRLDALSGQLFLPEF